MVLGDNQLEQGVYPRSEISHDLSNCVCRLECTCYVFDREAIDVQSIMVKEKLCHGFLDSITSTSTVSLSTSTTNAHEC